MSWGAVGKVNVLPSWARQAGSLRSGRREIMGPQEDRKRSDEPDTRSLERLNHPRQGPPKNLDEVCSKQEGTGRQVDAGRMAARSFPLWLSLVKRN